MAKLYYKYNLRWHIIRVVNIYLDAGLYYVDFNISKSIENILQV